MFYYHIYNYILATDIKFDMLLEFHETISNKKIIYLHINENCCDTIDFKISFSEGISYYIVKPKNSIYVFTENINLVFISLFNIPMSAYCLLDNRLLLHCNTLITNNTLFCIGGKKGVGKTTMSLFLSKKYEIYSDDSLSIDNIDNMICGFSGSDYIKISKNTYDLYINDGKFGDYYNEFSEKAIINLERPMSNPLRLTHFFYLVRGNIDKPVFTKVNLNAAKASIIIESVLGKNYIDGSLLKNIYKTPLYDSLIKNVFYYIVTVPELEKYDRKFINNFETVLYRGSNNEKS